MLKNKNYSIPDEVKAFILSAVIFFALHETYSINKFYYDSELYWALAHPSIFSDFPNTLRGYFYPLLLSPVRWMSDSSGGGFLLYRIFSSAAYGFLLGVFLPNFYVWVFGGKLTLFRRLLIPFFITIIFPGIILYPLSDLPALLLLIGAIWSLKKAKNGENGREYFYALMAGIFLGGAYNTRTVYIFSLICVLLVFLLQRKDFSSWKRHLIAFGSIFLGLLIVSLPQMLINKKHHGVYTPTVVAGAKISEYQLKWGVAVQKYSTTIDENAPAPSLFYLDKAGMKILANSEEGRARGGFPIKDYIGFVAKNPFDFLSIYARHIVAGLDVRDGDLYVKNHLKKRNMISAFNFFVVFFGIWVFLSRIKDKTPEIGTYREQFTWLFVILIPVAAIIPGAIETRFFLPLHLLIYCSIAFKMDWIWVKKQFQTSPGWIGFFFLAFLLYLAITSTTDASLEYYFDRGEI